MATSSTSLAGPVDINPLIMLNDQAVAVDAQVVVKPTAVQAPLHLVISPYPQHLESRLQIEEVATC